MKKMLLLLVCLTTFAWLHAETATFTCADKYGTSTISAEGTWQLNDVLSFTFAKGGGSSAPAYNKAKDVRLYAKNTATLKALDGYTIESVVFILSSQGKQQYATITSSDGAMGTQAKGDVQCSWTGDVSSVTFTVGASNDYGTSTSKSAGQLCFTSVTVTYSKAGPATQVATPSFSVEGAVEVGTKVEIDCKTADAKIYYTTDETDPTETSTLYDASTGIIVNEAMTVKAIAVKEGLEPSKIAIAEYTIKKTTAANIAEFISLAQPAESADYYTIENSVTAVYQNGLNLYVKDDSGWLLIYGSVGQTYNNGDVIAAGIKGQSVNRNNNIQMSNPEASTFVAGVAGTAVEPEEVTAVTAEDANKYVVVKGATISGVSGKDATLKVGTTTIALYNNLGITLTEGTNLTVTGFVNIFGQTVQIVPSEITTATGEEVVAAPTFDPAPGAVEKGTAVTIACATEGATIMYQINDGDLIEYDGQPIIINEATTIGAWAEKEGMADSDVVTAEYTIKAEIPEANKASFDFTKTGLYDKDGNLIGMPASGKGLDLPTVTLTNNHVFISFAQTGSEQKPRIYNSASSSSSGTTLRLYDGNTMTITATGGLKIESIEFTGSTLNAISTETGSYTNGVWTPSAARASNVESVVFKSSGKPTIKTINVVTSGVYDSVDDIVIDENAPVEYYNLQGVRVANPENGIYIRRQGSKVSKVLVK